jgi:hypothetical protein
MTVMYGCETQYVTAREEHQLQVFGNRPPKKTFGLQKDEFNIMRRIWGKQEMLIEFWQRTS